MSYQNFHGYAGDILAVDAYTLLEGESTSVLIDVRTRAEWAYVGIPDIQALGKTTLFLEWQSYPSMAVDTSFAASLEALLLSGGVERGASLVFLCRSGARSRHAATAMTSAGWAPCFNVSDGFEGPLGDSRQRGGAGGWKAGGLPWTQT
jgi:rhodanese-related sulfurtransferase